MSGQTVMFLWWLLGILLLVAGLISLFACYVVKNTTAAKCWPCVAATLLGAVICCLAACDEAVQRSYRQEIRDLREYIRSA